MISAMVIWAVYNPAAALSAEDDQVFVDMINQIRTAPYDYAIGLDYLPEDLIAKGILPETRYESYSLDEDLSATAADESHAMAETESQLMAGEDITEPEELPVHRLTASTGGVVSFFNFMTRETAFKIVIDYLFKEELDNNTFNHILSEEYANVGIAISAGKVGSGNAWFVAICLGSAELVSEIQMLNLINQVRADPENIWKYLEFDQTEAFNLNANISSLFDSDNVYKPLFFDASLSASAQAQSFYILNEMYLEEALSETQTALERAKYYEYEGDVVQEPFLSAYSSPEENGLSVDSLFLWLIEKELEKWPDSPVAFLTDFQDVGSSIAFLPGGEIYDWDTSVLYFVMGKKDPNTSNDESSSSSNNDDDDDEMSRIYGILFEDIDGDDLYAPGEELRQQTVTVSVYMDDVDEMQEYQRVVTDNAGHFSIPLETNRQYNFTATITIEEENVQVPWEGNDGDYSITSDQFVKLVYVRSPAP
jgi:hypothetical protein